MSDAHGVEEHPNGLQVADVLIASLLAHPQSTLWFEPMLADKHPDAHRISVERNRKELVSAVFGGGLGDAVIARFAFLCELDLLSRTRQIGRCSVQSTDHHFELLVTIRPSQTGMRGEVQILDNEPAKRRAATIPMIGLPLPDMLPDDTVIGSYRVDGVLGHGGMGVVYRVEHVALRKMCAMKVLRSQTLESDPASVDRFMGEARAAARIHNSQIVDVTDFGTLSDGRPYLVMELISGAPLNELMRAGAIEPQRSIQIVYDIARALNVAHMHGVIHRDLTPSNIFVEDVDGQEHIKIVDFGAAFVIDPEEENVPTAPAGEVFGTPYYMAPEQARGLVTDERSDLYSLGVILFELLSGDVPFDGDSIRSVLRQHVLDDPPAPRSPHEPVSEDLERIVAQCLRKKPDERYQSAAELAEELSRVQQIRDRKGWRKWLPV